ncbi:hypothetical protein [Collinsella tanakaei]|uniref:hypothetical protein n=1 Tax=Collinsella tanakaei TaxID=626935 RepID=UPI0025A3F4E5|nr:hypothetical protein [Collinsella tanakaei]MDM8302284.1 hypothetical protein [Collinsella tanakaei]
MTSHLEDFDIPVNANRPQEQVDANPGSPVTTQNSPIVDPDSTASGARQPFVPRSHRPRKHMGTATSDPDYLPPVTHGVSVREQGPSVQPARQHHGQPVNYARYLEVPKSKSVIFTRRERAQRRTHLLIALAVAVIILIVLLWLFVLR